MTRSALAVAAITLDFGNTLVRVDRQGSRIVIAETAARLMHEGVITDAAAFVAAWAEERDRQFREEVPKLREVDVAVRAGRVLARGRGLEPPPADAPWDDEAAGRYSSADEIEAVVTAHSRAFVERMTPVPDATATLARLAESGFALAILSNWPLAVTIDRFAAAQGWLPYLRAIVVSQRVGVIKPHPSIFRAAEDRLGLAARGRLILHVGDDWAADVIGASRAGWRVAYLRDHQADTPLPTSRPGGAADDPDVQADLEIDALSDLPKHVELARPT
jgi:HAD superfamily hydrolase (TIGR01509 family)